MLKECLEEDKEVRQVQFANAMNAKGDNFAADSLFVVLILQQQRVINQLISKLSNVKKLFEVLQSKSLTTSTFCICLRHFDLCFC